MKISSKTEYALRTLVDLALQGKGSIAHIGDIAGRQKIPVKFLEQILLGLKSAGLVASRRGANGGYLLALPPSRITLASIVSLTDDYLLSKSDPDPEKNRSKGQQNNLKDASDEIWTDINNYVLQKLETTTLQRLCDRMEELHKTESTNYFI